MQSVRDIFKVERKVMLMAEKLYSNLPYHNFPHATEVAVAADLLAEKLGFSPAWRSIFRMSGLLHDGLYGYKPIIPGLYHEKFIGKTAGAYIEDYGGSSQVAQMVVDIIDASSPLGPFSRPEHFIMRAADLSKISGEFERFSLDWERLLQERTILSGREIDKVTFARGSIAYLALFLNARIELSQEYYNEQAASRFHTGAVANVIRKSSQYWHQAGRQLTVVGEWNCGSTPLTLDHAGLINPDTLYVGIEPSAERRGAGLQLVQEAAKRQGQQAPNSLFIPGEKAGISLPTESLDVLYLRNTWEQAQHFPLGEMARVLKPGGQLKIIETGGRHQTSTLDQVQAAFDNLGLQRDSFRQAPNRDFALTLVK